VHHLMGTIYLDSEMLGMGFLLNCTENTYSKVMNIGGSVIVNECTSTIRSSRD